MEITLDDIDFSHLTIIDSNGNKKTVDLQDELVIDQYNIEKELYEQPKKYVYYTSLLEKVRAYLESAELALDVEHANLYEPSRASLQQETGSKPTKDQIESRILSDETYREKKEQVAILEGSVKNLYYIVKAFEQRKDMLIQLSTHERKREEYEQALNRARINNGYDPN